MDNVSTICSCRQLYKYKVKIVYTLIGCIYNSKAWTGLPSNGHIKKTVSTSHRRVFSQHPHKAPRGCITNFHNPPPPHHHTNQVIPKLACLPNKPRQTHSRIYVYMLYEYMNNFYLIFIECLQLRMVQI